MKKDISSFFTKIIYLLFIIGTIITMSILYKNIKNKVAIGFVIVYVIFTFLFLFYIIFIAILNSRKLKWLEIRGRIFKLIISFILLWVLSYGFDYFFRPSKIDLLREGSIAFGLSFGIYFTDIIFLKNNKN